MQSEKDLVFPLNLEKGGLDPRLKGSFKKLEVKKKQMLP